MLCFIGYVSDLFDLDSLILIICFRHCKIRSKDVESRNFDGSTCEVDVHELDDVINNLGYHNRMGVNSLLDYPCENDACSEVQSLEEIAASILKNDDEAEDDIAVPSRTNYTQRRNYRV